MHRLLRFADAVLRAGPRVTRAGQPAATLRQLLLITLLFGLLYGGVMGSFGGIAGGRIWQVVFSAVKVPLLLLVTFLLALPSFFVLNTLAGTRRDLPEVLRALTATQAGLTLVLASLAPFTGLWYLSGSPYAGAVLFNAGMFAVAVLAAAHLLRGYYRPLLARDPRHRLLLRAWLFLYAFIAVQMGWMLRPFVGDPSAPTRFFREDTWGNAYLILAQLLWRVLF